MIGAQFRRFSWAMGLAVIMLTSVLLYMQSGLQAGLAALQDDFMPRWQIAQRLQGDAQNVGAKASQLTLAFTLGELQSMHEDLSEQIVALESSLQAVIGQADDADLAQNLVTTASDFHQIADELAEAVRHRVTSPAALPVMDQQRRRERDLARLMGDHSVKLASYSSMLAADINIAFASHRQNLMRRLWLQGLFISLAGIVMGVLIWQQFHLLDHRLIHRIRALEIEMAKTDLDQNLLAKQVEVDEIDAMRNELARLLNRLTDQNAELERLATTDGLTGLTNRRRLFEHLEQEVYRARRYGTALSLILFDIDHFKRINDNWGHAAGDCVLREIAHEAHRLLRKADTAGRYGGEEFVVLLPETDLAEAMLLAHRLNRQISHMVITPEHSSPISVTVSVGVAEIAPDESGEDLIQRADQALYRAKREGRNRVEAAAIPADLDRQKTE
ncbi:MAG: diguanylate cyclase [Candidatus Competibacter sp.]|nr:diguanylate cyclase [Candidatus Competibacter sp.]MDG4605828.1 diguanylate cyclase [Candidatus Contendobacter sp.]